MPMTKINTAYNKGVSDLAKHLRDSGVEVSQGVQKAIDEFVTYATEKADIDRFDVEVQGFPYDEEKWKEVAGQVQYVGDIFMKYFKGASGHLFWETATNLEVLIKIIKHVNKTQKYIEPCEVNDEENA